jgi:hypothetical protein
MTEDRLLTVYSRRGCHLCEDLLAELETWLRGRARIEVIDVDSDASLRDTYGLRVPVVSAYGHELCHYRLDRAVVQAWLDRA